MSAVRESLGTSDGVPPRLTEPAYNEEDVRPTPLDIPQSSSRRRLWSAGSARPGSRSRARTPKTGRASEWGGENMMLQAKQARRKAEEEVKLLMNRLHHLKLQEEKTLRRIADTEVRAKEVLELKKQHTAAKTQLAAHEEDVTRKILADQEEIHKVVEERRQRLMSVRERIAHEKRVQALSLRHMKKQLAADVQQVKESVTVMRRHRTAVIRQQRQDRHEKIEMEKARLGERVAERYAKKIEDEAKAAELAAQMVKSLEDKESELIERVRQAQESQRRAYAVLQQSIIADSVEAIDHLQHDIDGVERERSRSPQQARSAASRRQSRSRSGRRGQSGGAQDGERGHRDAETETADDLGTQPPADHAEPEAEPSADQLQPLPAPEVEELGGLGQGEGQTPAPLTQADAAVQAEDEAEEHLVPSTSEERPTDPEGLNAVAEDGVQDNVGPGPQSPSVQDSSELPADMHDAAVGDDSGDAPGGAEGLAGKTAGRDSEVFALPDAA